MSSSAGGAELVHRACSQPSESRHFADAKTLGEFVSGACDLSRLQPLAGQGVFDTMPGTGVWAFRMSDHN